MKRLLQSLQIQFREEKNNEHKFYVAHDGRDKILILADIQTPYDLRDIAQILPDSIDALTQWINSPKDREQIGKRVKVAQYLWDLYVVGFHKYQEEKDKFDPIDVSNVQRDRFIARKIVIEYRSEDEMELLFKRSMLPHVYLNEKVKADDMHLDIPNELHHLDEFLKELDTFLEVGDTDEAKGSQD